jgi:hypothetical protein
MANKVERTQFHYEYFVSLQPAIIARYLSITDPKVYGRTYQPALLLILGVASSSV